jgi:tetratricopeptide (TPR) repeat protein
MAGTVVVVLLGCASVAAQAPSTRAVPPGAEAVSLLGQPLISKPPTGEVLARLEANLAAARKEYDANPASADAIIWLGRRTAYLGHFRDAIAIFTQGIAKHPRDARMYRHRGHRYISVREFARAIADLEMAVKLEKGKADQVEPDGQPNARNTPIGTTQSNIWYHLGLAYYVRGDFKKALAAYRECDRLSSNPDRVVSTGHWLYMTLRRLGRTAEAEKVLAPVMERMDIIENHSYHRLLLLYKGVLKPEDLLGKGESVDIATLGYGVANWHHYNGRKAEARELWRKILEGEAWSAFGYIAAEAEVAGLSKK